jgi:pyruvate kinase
VLRPSIHPQEYFGCYTLHPNLSKREALASSAVRAAAKINAK